MIRSLTQQVVRVAMLATLTVAVAEAQSGGGSDFTGPGGGGGGAGGSYAPLGVPAGARSGPLGLSGIAGLSGVANIFGSPGLGGLSIPNPAGGTVTISPETARAIAAVLTGGGAEAVTNILVGEGVPSGAAGSLANALAKIGSRPSVPYRPSRANLFAAIDAFNAAIDAGPSAPSPAMLAIRFALASASR